MIYLNNRLNAEQQLKHLIYEKDQIINYQSKFINELNSKLEVFSENINFLFIINLII